MALADKVNQYFSQHTPWKALESNPERARTIIYVALRCVDNLKVLMTPFLPFTCQRLHEMLGSGGTIAGMPQMREATEDDGSSHLILTGDYSKWTGRWEPSALPPGQKLAPPQPLFRKLEDSVVADELVRMEGAAPASH
jgi:methionyl-tRNA synthetase